MGFILSDMRLLQVSEANILESVWFQHYTTAQNLRFTIFKKERKGN